MNNKRTFEDYLGIAFATLFFGMVMNMITMCVCTAIFKMTDITSIKMISFIGGAVGSLFMFILAKEAY